jgi:hypothetical protein
MVVAVVRVRGVGLALRAPRLGTLHPDADRSIFAAWSGCTRNGRCQGPKKGSSTSSEMLHRFRGSFFFDPDSGRSVCAVATCRPCQGGASSGLPTSQRRTRHVARARGTTPEPADQRGCDRWSLPCSLWLFTVTRVIFTLAYPVSNPTGSDGPNRGMDGRPARPGSHPLLPAAGRPGELAAGAPPAQLHRPPAHRHGQGAACCCRPARRRHRARVLLPQGARQPEAHGRGT